MKQNSKRVEELEDLRVKQQQELKTLREELAAKRQSEEEAA